MFSIEEMVEEVQQEIRWRRRVYPRLVSEGKMSEAQAERKIAIMEAVCELLRERSAPAVDLEHVLDHLLAEVEKASGGARPVVASRYLIEAGIPPRKVGEMMRRRGWERVWLVDGRGWMKGYDSWTQGFHSNENSVEEGIHSKANSVEAPIHSKADSVEPSIHSKGNSVEIPIHSNENTVEVPIHSKADSVESRIHSNGNSVEARIHSNANSVEAREEQCASVSCDHRLLALGELPMEPPLLMRLAWDMKEAIEREKVALCDRCKLVYHAIPHRSVAITAERAVERIRKALAHVPVPPARRPLLDLFAEIDEDLRALADVVYEYVAGRASRCASDAELVQYLRRKVENAPARLERLREALSALSCGLAYERGWWRVA